MAQEENIFLTFQMMATHFLFVEVHYENGEPVGYTDAFMGGDAVEELRELVDRLTRALDKPVLHESEFGGEQ